MAVTTMQTTHRSHPTDVVASLSFIRPDSKMNRRYMAAGKEISIGEYETKQVPIHDGRPEIEKLKLETTGFQLVSHESKVNDWTSMPELESTYSDEIRDLMLKMTGADEIIVFGPVRRNTGNKKADNTDGAWNEQPPASDVHVDFTPLRAECLAVDFAKKRGLDKSSYSRFKLINLWRAISPGPQDWPLAVCRGDSVGDEEGVVNDLIYVDQIPDLSTLPEKLPEDPMHPEGSLFPYRPEHRWTYFSNMKRDELLLFTLYDSEKVKPWRVPHTAFLSNIQGAMPRESVEIRTLCFFR